MASLSPLSDHHHHHHHNQTVFISFRGDDTRNNFTSHLVAALKRKHINTFIDNKLEKGEEISPTLSKAIEDSEISVVVLSRNYSSSSWCMDELSRIIECKNKKNMIVLPIFYHIDPSEVRKIRGSYAKNYFDCVLPIKGSVGYGYKVQNWRSALKEVANLSGWHFPTQSIGRCESELIEEIVADISRKLIEKSSHDGKVKTDLQKTLAANEVPAFSLDELKQATENFGSRALLGESPFGEVYRAVFDNGKAFAVKTFDVSSAPESDDNFLYQVYIVSRLKHDNIIRLCGYCIEGDMRLLAYDFARRGTLYNILHVRKGILGVESSSILNWMQRVRIAVDVAKGLEYLHEKVQPSIVHGDIRSKSVLIYPDFTAKIVSLNLSCQDLDVTTLLHSPRSLGGAVGYHAPECAMDGKLTLKSDVYSFGIVLLELLTGRKPIDYARPRGYQSLVTWASVDKVIESVDPKLNGEYPLDGVAKMASAAIICLQREAESRPNMSIIVKALQPLLEVSAPGSS